MDSNPQQFNDDQISAAIEAATNFTPDSIEIFRALNDLDAQVVIRVLKQTNPAKPARTKRKDAGVTRGPRVTETGEKGAK